MAWIESHTEIWDHHKTARLCAAVNKPDYAVVGWLHSLWHFVLKNAWRDANLEAWGDDGIERAARWDGEKGVFINALRECGFLDGSVVHGWHERAGGFVLNRLRNEKRRHKRYTRGKVAVNKRYTRGKVRATIPNLTIPNHTLPKDSKSSGAETKAPGDPRVSVLIKDFYTHLEAQLGEKPAAFNGGAAGKIFTHLLKTNTPEEITKRIMDWFASTDPFIAKNGWRVEMFNMNFNTLKGGPIHANANTRASGGYVGAPPIPGKYAGLGKPKQPAETE